MASSSPPRVVNRVHDDEHWRQRLKLESSTNNAWAGSWGFMQKGTTIADQKTSKAQLHATAAKLGPMAEYLERSRAATGTSTGVATRALPEAGSSLSSTRSATGSASAGVAGVDSTGLISARTTTSLGGEDEALAEALKLDKQTARQTLAGHVHNTGFSGHVSGVSPPEKYRFPQTEQQKIGWQHKRAQESLLMRTQRTAHGKRGLKLHAELWGSG